MGRRHKGEIQQRHERGYRSVKEPTRTPKEESASQLTTVVTISRTIGSTIIHLDESKKDGSSEYGST